MKTKETSSKEQALAWKETLDIDTQIDLCIKYNDICNLHGRLMSNLTDREIEQIWRKENFYTLEETKENIKNFKFNQKQLPKELEGVIPRITTIEEKVEAVKEWNKKNQKQFKQFDESLFKSYIDKFSDEDKVKALEILIGVNIFSTSKEKILEKIENLIK